MAHILFKLIPLWAKTLFFRFSPLWIALIIAIILPPSREMLRFHIISSDVLPQFYNWGQPWNDYGDDFDPKPLLRKEPNNAALAYWKLRAQAEKGRNYYYYDEYSSGGTGASKDLFSLSKKFPEQLWLKSLALQAYTSEIPIVSNSLVRPGGAPLVGRPKKNAAKIPEDKYKFVQDCARKEPDNAFWLVYEAYFRSLQFNYKAANSLLSRAAKCRVYDDKLLETARELVRVQSRFRPLSWEEKKVLYEDRNEVSSFAGPVNNEMNRLSIRSLQSRDYAHKLAVSVNLMRIGGLMQEGTNSLANCRNGISLQNMAWRLGNPKQKIFKYLPNSHLSFARNVQQNGHPALAKEALLLKKESDTINSWASKKRNESWGFSPVYLNQGVLAERANYARDAGMVLVGFCGYLILWWSFLNVFLFRGQGIASTRRERIMPVIVFGALFLLLAGFLIWWNQLIWDASTPRSPLRDGVMVTIGTFAFAGLPFVLALFCALATMRRFKTQFGLPPRVDMEMQLSEFHRGLLHWLLPFAVFSSLSILVFGWLLYFLSVLFDWGYINVLAWLPPDRNGVTGDLSFHPVYNPIPLIYGLIMSAVCLGVWFLKWRFFTAKELKIFTHTGLRRWKETMGIAIVVTIGIYIFAAICLWPTRIELNRRMDKVLAEGPLSMTPSTVSQSINNGGSKFN